VDGRLAKFHSIPARLFSAPPDAQQACPIDIAGDLKWQPRNAFLPTFAAW
jgi:hypothetical protein